MNSCMDRKDTRLTKDVFRTSVRTIDTRRKGGIRFFAPSGIGGSAIQMTSGRVFERTKRTSHFPE